MMWQEHSMKDMALTQIAQIGVRPYILHPHQATVPSYTMPNPPFLGALRDKDTQRPQVQALDVLGQ